MSLFRFYNSLFFRKSHSKLHDYQQLCRIFRFYNSLFFRKLHSKLHDYQKLCPSFSFRFCCGFSYYGLTLGVGTLSGDMGTNYVFMGTGDVLTVFAILFTAKM